MKSPAYCLQDFFFTFTQPKNMPMKKVHLYVIAILIVWSGISCKAKKCANFSDPKNNYHVNYNKKGLVKSKNKRTTTWTDKY